MQKNLKNYLEIRWGILEDTPEFFGAGEEYAQITGDDYLIPSKKGNIRIAGERVAYAQLDTAEQGRYTVYLDYQDDAAAKGNDFVSLKIDGNKVQAEFIDPNDSPSTHITKTISIDNWNRYYADNPDWVRQKNINVTGGQAKTVEIAGQKQKLEYAVLEILNNKGKTIGKLDLPPGLEQKAVWGFSQDGKLRVYWVDKAELKEYALTKDNIKTAKQEMAADFSANRVVGVGGTEDALYQNYGTEEYNKLVGALEADGDLYKAQQLASQAQAEGFDLSTI